MSTEFELTERGESETKNLTFGYVCRNTMIGFFGGITIMVLMLFLVFAIGKTAGLVFPFAREMFGPFYFQSDTRIVYNNILETYVVQRWVPIPDWKEIMEFDSLDEAKAFKERRDQPLIKPID